jgi:hypothetical protein
MDTKTRVIEIARVERQNSSGSDVRYEQLIDGKPEHRPGYTAINTWGKRELQEGESFQTFTYLKFFNIWPSCAWPVRLTNVGGQLVQTMWRTPRTALNVYEISDRP